jgi:hypothetical protein
MTVDGRTLIAQEWVVTEAWDAGRGCWYCVSLRAATGGEVVDEAEHDLVSRQEVYAAGDRVETWEVRRCSRQRRVDGLEALRILRKLAEA